ncbi:MAG: hypothetical protein ACP5MD_15410, partial [Verrucomicrobiia bacterium]
MLRPEIRVAIPHRIGWFPHGFYCFDEPYRSRYLFLKPVAIHHRPGSFSDRWIEYCRDCDIPHIVVNAYATDIIDRLRGASAFLW